jgi:hypothetical protein
VEGAENAKLGDGPGPPSRKTSQEPRGLIISWPFISWTPTFLSTSCAKLIEQRGIDFALAEDFIQTLKTAGASEAFLNALRAAKPPEPASANKPINQAGRRRAAFQALRPVDENESGRTLRRIPRIDERGTDALEVARIPGNYG